MKKKRAMYKTLVEDCRLKHPSLTVRVSASRHEQDGAATLTLSFHSQCGEKFSGVNALIPVPEERLKDERFDDIATNLVFHYVRLSLPNVMLFAADSLAVEAAWVARRMLGAENVSEDKFVNRQLSINNDVLRRRLRMRRRGNESLWSREELIEIVRAALNSINNPSRLNQPNAAKAINKLYKDKLKRPMTGNGLAALLKRQNPRIEWLSLRNERKKAILTFDKSK